MKKSTFIHPCILLTLLTFSTPSLSADFMWSIASSAIAYMIGAIAVAFVMGVGIYAIMTFVLGIYQFLIGVLFGPIGLLLMPLDKGRVLSSTLSMMLTGLFSFGVAFTTLFITVELFAGAVEKFSAIAIAEGEGGKFKIMFALASVIYAYIMYQIIQQSSSWASALFGGVGFNLQGVVRGMGRAGGMVGGSAGGMGSNAGGRAVEAGARGVAGGLGGAVGGAKAGGGLGKVAALKGAGKGFASGLVSGARGRGGEFSKMPPALGSGMRLKDSFKQGGKVAASKSQGKSKDALLKTPSKSEFMDSAHSQ